MSLLFWPFWREGNKTLREVNCSSNPRDSKCGQEFSASETDGCVSLGGSFFPGERQCFTPVHTMTFPAVLSDVLINFLKEVAAAAPALPFYYYHIPALTGVKSKYRFFPCFFPFTPHIVPYFTNTLPHSIPSHPTPCHKIIRLLTKIVPMAPK